MTKHLLTIALLGLSTITAQAQYDFVDPEYQPPCGKAFHPKIEPFISSYFCWKDWEIEKTMAEREQFLSHLERPDKIWIDHYMIDEEYEDTLSSIVMTADALKVLDYNQDGFEDVIYPVWVPWAKSYYTTFWKGGEEQFKFDFQIVGAIVQMKKGSFIGYHELCCSDYTHYVKEYALQKDIQKPSFELTNYYGFIDDFRRMKYQSKLDIKFSEPKSVILNQMDTIYGYSGGIHRSKMITPRKKHFNPVAIYPSGTNAKILSSIKGPGEQTWLFISLEIGVQLVKTAYLRDHRIGSLKESKDQLQYMGWVKSHQVIYPQD